MDIDFKPTEEMASNAERGLALREKHGRGGTAIGVARARDIKAVPGLPRVAGLDVAEFGSDSSALCVRQGPVLVHLSEWRGVDVMTTTGRVAKAYRDRAPGFDVVYVDAIGMGAGVAERLAELRVPVVRVNVAESSALSPRFRRLRDELWWSVRDWFEGRACRIGPEITMAEELIGQMAGVKYREMSDGRGEVKIESKAEMRKRGQPSPNMADALCLTFAAGSASVVQSVMRGALDGREMRVEVAADYPLL